MNTTENPNPDDGFGKIVRDILIDYEAGDVERPAAVQAIIDAYCPRIAAARADAEGSRRATAAYAATDRAQQEVLKYVKASVSQLVMANAAHLAHIGFLTRIRNAVRVLIDDATKVESATVNTVELLEALSQESRFPRADMPLQIGLAVDIRWSVGHFKQYDHEVTMKFLGWSMVVRSAFEDSLLEPTFLGYDGRPVTLTELGRAGYELIRLT